MGDSREGKSGGVELFDVVVGHGMAILKGTCFFNPNTTAPERTSITVCVMNELGKKELSRVKYFPATVARAKMASVITSPRIRS